MEALQMLLFERSLSSEAVTRKRSYTRRAAVSSEAGGIDQLDMFDQLFESVLPGYGNPAEWSEEEVSMLHEWLLVRSLETLAAATRPDVIQEHLEWVNGDIDGPFSFYTCCAVSGYNYEGILEGINNIYKIDM